jgi:hypothetical protein
MVEPTQSLRRLGLSSTRRVYLHKRNTLTFLYTIYIKTLHSLINTKSALMAVFFFLLSMSEFFSNYFTSEVTLGLLKGSIRLPSLV